MANDTTTNQYAPTPGYINGSSVGPFSPVPGFNSPGIPENVSTYKHPSKATSEGEFADLKVAELYGQNQRQTGEQVQDIIRQRQARLSGNDPASTQIRNSRNRQLRMAKASGASPEELAQISRNAETDIGASEFTNQGRTLGEYQSLVGNMLSGQTSMEMGYRGLLNADNKNMVPSGGGGLGSIICSELHRQGYMSDYMREKDAEYGFNVMIERPNVYFGYIFMARPIVKLMKKSKAFTYIVSIPAMKWARNMAGDSNLIGKLISKYGEKFCGIIGETVYGNLQKTKV